ncbi:hypothetical protein GGX14DRAFT_397388 [Mycena pura]|uniref:Uncharacterized protein n=1 Tax=Mycena pura TaxID=153505 RepID=A0AAD6YAR5_9AGAR|nr:hypothetical protein GGX14DRAFT_397388 [Mycena pura]
MSPPKSPHPLAELRTPPDEYTPCDVPNYLGSNFSGHDSFSQKNNKFYWVVYLGRNQGMYSLKATAVAHLDGYSRERAMECYSTYDAVTAGWKKHCFHHRGHCSVHSLACAKSPCTRHAAPRCVMEARERVAISYGLTLPRPSDDTPAANRNPSRRAGNDERRILQNSPAVRDAARHIAPAVRDATRHVTPIPQALEGQGVVTGASGHGLPGCPPAPSVPQAHERAHAKAERDLTPALGDLSGTLDETGNFPSPPPPLE